MNRKLSAAPAFLNTWALLAAFSTYFFMYMFRKPFTAGAFEAASNSVWDGKTAIVSSQVLGYLCSKLIGIRVVSQMPAGKRAVALFGLILASEGALLLFGLLPTPYRVLAIFLNGLPLGMVFGLVLGFLEGRRMTEALVAGLCASFIVAGGFSKTLGQWTLDFLVNTSGFSVVQAEHWMPAIAGGLFILPIAVSVWMLSQIPAPSEHDRLFRSHRTPMTTEDRTIMLRRYGLGLTCVAVFYLTASVLRGLRDDFAPQILAGMGADTKASDYSWIDTQVALLVLTVNGLTAFVRSHRLAVQLSLFVSLFGFLLIGFALYRSPSLSPIAFMVLIGAGLYLPFVAVHTTLFERLIALTRDRGNMAFLMYVVDSLGYLGYVVVLLLPRGVVFGSQTSENAFYVDFRWYCTATVLISITAATIAVFHFSRLEARSTTTD